MRGTSLGRYMLLSQVGTGAMGVVFAAYDPELDRKVALKLLRPRGSDLARSRQRLQREAQALAKLGHPNVVAVYDVGVHDEQLFVAMEFVEGQTLGAWMSTLRGGTRAEAPVKARPWREVLAVFEQAGRGLGAAHEAGLVHRDFKPDNVMLSADGRVRVMDFGLARVDEDGEVAETVDPSANIDSLTQTGALLGTPAYMSLEQFGSGPVDARSDQFGFCVALYEALYGERPFVGETVGELVVAVENGAVREPHRSAQVPSWVRDVVLRGLAKQPEARFPSMQLLLDALAADPVARRRRLVLRTGLGLALVAASWGVVSLSGEVEQRDAVIEEQASELELKNAALEQQLAVQARLLSVQRGLRAKALVRTGNEAEALLLGVQAVGAYASAWAEAPREAVEGLEQVLAHDAVIMKASHVLEGHEDYLTYVSYSPDGARLATASFDGSVRIWDPAQGELRATLDDHGGKLFHVAFSPDGSRLATGSADGRARIWDVESGERVATLVGHEAALTVLAFSPDGAQLATGGLEQTVRIWDVERGASLFTLAGDRKGVVADLAYTPDGTRLVTAGGDTFARVWDPKTGELLTTLAGHEGSILALTISPDGTHVATASEDARARIWDLETGELVTTLVGHEGRLTDLAYAPDGRRLTTVSWDKTGRVFDPETGELVATLAGGHGYGIACLTYSPSGTSVATSSYEGSVVIWDAETGALEAKLRGHTADVWGLAFAPDGHQLATASVDHSARLWDLDAKVTVLEGPGADIRDFACSPDGTRLATVSTADGLRLWAGETGEPPLTLERDASATRSIAYAPDGKQIAAVVHGLLQTWDPQTGALLSTTNVADPEDDVSVRYSTAGTLLQLQRETPRGPIWIHDAHTLERLSTIEPERRVHGLAYSVDDARLAMATEPATVQLWDPRTGSLATELVLPEDRISRVAYSPDGTELATLSVEVGIRLWNAQDLTPRVTLAGSRDAKFFAYAPDGTQLAGLSNFEDVWIWDAETGELRLAIEPDTQDPRTNMLAYSPEGSRLAVLGARLVRTYDSNTGQFLAYIDGRRTVIHRFVFSPDATRLTSLGADRSLEIWDAETGELLTRERIGIKREDGSIASPIPPRELTRIGCTLLEVFDRTYPQAQDICPPLLGH